MSHTPGPWRFEEEPPYGKPVVMAGGYYIASTYSSPGQDPRSTPEANARLIASAPDLLEALEGLIWLAEPHFTDKTHREHLMFCRAAIAKAKGEA